MKYATGALFLPKQKEDIDAAIKHIKQERARCRRKSSDEVLDEVAHDILEKVPPPFDVELVQDELSVAGMTADTLHEEIRFLARDEVRALDGCRLTRPVPMWHDSQLLQLLSKTKTSAVCMINHHLFI